MPSISSASIDSITCESGQSEVKPVTKTGRIHSKLLNESSEEAQAYRRHLLRGQRVLIVQGGAEHRSFIYQKLRDLGVKVTVMDSKNSVWASHSSLDEFIPWEKICATGTIGAVQRALAAIHGRRFDAVTTFWEHSVAIAAEIAAAIGVAVNPASAFTTARDKLQVRMACAKAGLPTPFYALIQSEQDIEAAKRSMKFPAVLKPTSGVSKMGVIPVSSAQDLEAAYKRVMSTVDEKNSFIWAQNTNLILEEFYEGEECDVDILLSQGKSVYAKVSDNWVSSKPYFQESGGICPSQKSEEQQNRLICLAVDTLKVLGFRAGAFHVEMIWTSSGPRLIEVNARMGGVSVHELNLVAWGVDLVEEHIMAVCGIPISPIIPQHPYQHIAELFLTAPFSGTLISEDWLSHIESNVHRAQYFKKQWDRVQGPEDGTPDWLACILTVSKENACSARNQLHEVVNSISVPVQPSVPDSTKPKQFTIPGGL